MTGVINPVVYGDRVRWATMGAAPYVAGALVGSGILALVLAASAACRDLVIARTATGIWVASGGLIVGLIQLRILPFRLPSRPVQVPRGWQRRYSLRLSAFAYGVVLGFGYLTVIYSPVFHLACLAAIMLLAPSSMWVVAAFGAVRAGGSMLAASVLSGDDLGSLSTVLTPMAQSRPMLGAVQLAVVTASIVVSARF